jgi:hypothetical protein
MKLILIILLTLRFAISVNAQNTPVKCLKTYWPLKESSQYDIYNIQGNRLQMIRINSKGDTTQWFASSYDTNQRKIEEYSLINKPLSKFHYRYLYDNLGNTIRLTSEGRDTIESHNPNIKLNYKGDQIFDGENKYIDYVYDKSGNKLRKTHYTSNSDTTNIELMTYDSNNNQLTHHFYSENNLSDYSIYEYDLSNRLTKQTVFRADGTINWTENNEYDQTGFCFKSFGINQWNDKWEMQFELIDCSLIEPAPAFQSIKDLDSK